MDRKSRRFLTWIYGQELGSPLDLRCAHFLIRDDLWPTFYREKVDLVKEHLYFTIVVAAGSGG
jgi:hypothetical protein